MRVIWNGMCDPTLHLIGITLLLIGIGSMLDIYGPSSQESGPVKRCRVCLFYHYKANLHCNHRHLIVASQKPTD